MNRETYLKELIEIKYGSVRYFSEQVKVPYTTIRSILERGVLNAKMDNIIKICKGLGIAPEQLYDFEESTVSKISKVTIKLNPERQERVYDFAEQQYNEQNNVIKMPKQHEVKVYGAVSAGTGEYLLDNEPEVMPFKGEVPDKYDFAVVVNGDSMLPLFENQQIIFVRKTTDIRSGQIVVVDYDQQAYVKKYISDEHGKRFVSLNKKYDDMPINVDHEAKAFGVVVL